jgi:hypothetical protein
MHRGQPNDTLGAWGEGCRLSKALAGPAPQDLIEIKLSDERRCILA